MSTATRTPSTRADEIRTRHRRSTQVVSATVPQQPVSTDTCPARPVQGAVTATPPATTAQGRAMIRESARVPQTVLNDLITGFAAASADEQRQATGSGMRPLRPGAHFGRVLAWAWNEPAAEDRFLAMQLLAKYLTYLRPLGSHYTLNVVLDKLRWALPADFTDYRDLVAQAQRDVPHLV